MDEVREAIRQIGAKYQPPIHDMDELVRQRSRRRVRNKLFISGLAFLIAGSGAAVALRAFPVGIGGDKPDVRTASSSCEVDPVLGYRLQVEPLHGPVGSLVTVTGPLPLYGEEGVYVGPPDWVEAWWNLNPDWSESPYFTDGRAAVPLVETVPVNWLGKVDTSGSTCLSLQFQVPDVPPGVYPIVVNYGDDAGFAAYPMAEFVVNPLPGPCDPECPSGDG
jgi:hypothetical protein